MKRKLLVLGFAMSLIGACGKDEPRTQARGTEAKGTEARPSAASARIAPSPAGAPAARPAGAARPASWPELTAAQCEQAARKKNVECRIKGTPEPKDLDGMLKMVVEACLMGNDMPEVGYVTQAQVACLDKADCQAWKDCVSDKEQELKAQLGK